VSPRRLVVLLTLWHQTLSASQLTRSSTSPTQPCATGSQPIIGPLFIAPLLSELHMNCAEDNFSCLVEGNSYINLMLSLVSSANTVAVGAGAYLGSAQLLSPKPKYRGFQGSRNGKRTPRPSKRIVRRSGKCHCCLRTKTDGFDDNSQWLRKVVPFTSCAKPS
jgi:hypothetical protein